MYCLRSKLVILVLATVTLTFGAGLALYGQGGGGQIVGTVADPSGAVLPGVAITARNTATGVVTEIKTNSEGAYRFTDLAIGEYTIVRATGFKTLEQTGVRIISGTVRTLDLKLDLGQANQTVQVSAAAVAVASTTSQTGTTRTTEELTELPLLVIGASRNAVSLLRTLPGVNVTPGLNSDAGHGMAQWPYGGITVATINGGIQGGATYFVDGVYNSAGSAEQLRDDFSPPPEMIDEMRLNANGTPEFGWNDGISVSLVEKTGTNQLHGSAFEYVRNTKLDARNFTAASVSDEKQNEWGFVVGGPVFLPHLYDGRNKTFFLATYGGYRYHTAPAGEVFSVPTAAMRQGDFSEVLGPTVGDDALNRPVYTNEIYDPNTTRSAPGGGYIRDPFMYGGTLNVIDPTRLSSVTNAFQSGYPLPNLSGYTYNFSAPLHESYVNSNKWSFKIDENIGDKQRLSFASEYFSESNFQGGLDYAPIIAGDYNSIFTTYHERLVYSVILRSNLVFSFRAALNRMIENDTYVHDSLVGATTAGLTGLGSTATPYIYLGPCCGTNGYYGIGNSGGLETAPLWTIPVTADLSWIKGKHSMKFGAQYLNNNEYYKVPMGGSTFNFLNLETGQPGIDSTGWNYASFWLGSVDNVGINGSSQLKYQDGNYGFYGMDSWRVNSKLTVNYGIRWDIYMQPHESQNKIAAISLTEPNPGAGNLPGAETFWGDGPGRNGRHAIGDAYLGGVGPTLGLAYAINPKTVVRASYGLTYANEESAFITLPSLSSTGFSASRSRGSLDNGVTPYLANWDSGIPAGFLPPVPDTDPTIQNGGSDSWWNVHNLRAARIQNISVGVEREIPGGILVKASYVGTMAHGREWLGSDDLDQLNPKYLSLGDVLTEPYNSPDAVAAGITSPYPGFNGLAWQALIPYPQFTAISAIEPTGWSTYNSGQFTVQKRATHGLTVLLSYTVSKELTTNTGSSFDPNQAFGLVTSPFVSKNYNGQKLKILADDDRPSNLHLSWVYELPFGPGQRFAATSNRTLRQIVGGWRVSGDQSYVSGVPMVVFGESALPSSLNQWAVQNPGVPLHTPGVNCGNYDPNSANNHYLNPAAFSNAAPYTFGDFNETSSLHACGFAGESLAVQKIFTLTERAHLTISGDINNIFNRHSWEGPYYNFTTDMPDFGVFRTATAPRLVQLHAKVEW